MENSKIIKEKNIFKWLFIVSLVLLTALSGILTYFLVTKNSQKNDYASALRNSYSRNFNELSSNLNEIDVNLSKLVGSSTNTARQKILLTIWRDCFASQTNLSNLPIEHESVEDTMGFVNRLGEYCYFLSTKLINGQMLSVSDLNKIEELSKYSNALSHDISLLALNVSNGNFDVLKISGSGLGDDFLAFLDDLKESAVDTPSMIYDGPYSESADEQEILGLADFTCTQEEAAQYLAEVFQTDIGNVSFISQTSANFETYNFMVNGEIFAQVTQKGKFLLAFNRETSEGSMEIDKEQAISKASQFLTYLGFENMEANWVNAVGGQFMINFAPVENGVLIYSDLIKIKLSGTGQVCGFEAISYAYNHTQRSIPENLISTFEANEVVDSRLNIKNIRLCIIPKQFAPEVLAYEFYCEYNDSTYYVYINATNGREEEIFKVVHDENEGELVI